jgi:hypothetical protein
VMKAMLLVHPVDSLCADTDRPPIAQLFPLCPPHRKAALSCRSWAR